MSDRQPAYAAVPCDTCGAEPGERCQTAEGEPFDFGGTHAARVGAGLTARPDDTTPRKETE